MVRAAEASLRVLVYAPTGRDAALTVEVLDGDGIEALACRSIGELVKAIEAGSGAVLLAEEAFEEEGIARLFSALEVQPSWSALPLLVMTSEEASAQRLLTRIGPLANVTILQRPARIAMLLSSIRSALRSRQRQYKTCGLLDQLREAGRQKDIFLATISHELRTPLNAIVGWTTIMKHESCNVPTHERGLEVLERNAAAQKTIIDDLLDVSRIIAGKVRLEMRLVDLRVVVAAAVESLVPTARAKQIDVRAPVPAEPLWIRGDSDRLQQITWNLVSNAIKFTAEGGRIEISTWHEGESVCLRVSDTGVGIAPEFLPHLFERFRQADGTTTRRHGGLGLGLAIVRNLAELHGGSVHARSDGENAGTTLVVTLPAATSPQPCADTPQAPESTEAAQLARQSCLQGMRVLVVDDSNDSLEMMTTLLESLGADVRGAESADDGLAQLIGWRPDALVSDIAMPERDGFWLIEQVRSLAPGEGGTTPAVALTALVDREDAARMLRAGFHRHLPKPVSLEELGAAMLALTGKG